MNRFVANRFQGGVVVLFMVAAVLVLSCPGTVAQAQQSVAKADPAPAGNAENGKRIYKTYGCYQCHGYAGQGGAGTRLAPNPILFTAFVKYNRQPTGQMPPYTSKVVSDSELADIFAFLQSLPKPPAAKSIPLLNN